MKNIRKLFGETKVKLEEWNYQNYYDEFKVEYYKIENLEKDNRRFGIEVLKKTKYKNNVIIERRKIENFLNTEEKVDKLLKILKRNRVTPIAVEDVIDDLKFKREL